MAFTSIKTTGGWSDDAVQAAYALKFNWALRANPLFYGLVDHQPQQVPHKGSSITEQLNAYYSEADVEAATTPLDEETDVTPVKLPATSSVTYTPKEYGFANQSTIYLSNRGLTPVDPVIATAVATHCKDTLDRLAQKEARTGTQVLRAAGRASTVTVAGGDLLTAADIRTAVTKLDGQSVQRRDGAFYLGIFHPNVIHDLREETGSGSWRVPKEYGTDQTHIWTGEFGAFEGVRFVSTPTVFLSGDEDDGAASVAVYRSFILGKEALGKAVVSEPTTVLSPVTDKLQRFRGIGWKADLDIQVYREEALMRLESATSVV